MDCDSPTALHGANVILKTNTILFSSRPQMERPKSLPGTVVLLFTSLAVKSSGQDFANARNAITSIKPSDMDYTKFCTQRPSGRYKTACRLLGFPLVGLLVCNMPDVDGKLCETIIDEEITTMTSLDKENVKTATFDPEAIQPLKCGKSAHTTCIGYMVAWITPQVGWFEHLSNIIRGNAVDTLLSKVKKETTKPGWAQTASDFTSIKRFMEYPPETRFRQICDLQGFFHKTGGFQVNDPDGVKEKMKPDERCWSDDDPMTREVLNALDKLIKELSKHNK